MMAAMKCNNCGADLSLAQAREGECAYCHAALPHAVHALEKEAALQRLLEDRDGDGIPDGVQALEKLQTAQRQRQAGEAAQKNKAQALKRAQTQLAEAKAARVRLGAVAWLALLIGLVVSIPYQVFVVRWLDQDPWFGAHHALLCPAVCDTCRGPYVIFAWTPYSTPSSKSAESTRVYCKPKRGYFDGYSKTDFFTKMDANKQYEVPGTTYALWASTVPMLFILALPFAFVLRRREVGKLKASVPDIEARLAALRRVD